MFDMTFYLNELQKLLAIDSTTSMFEEIQRYVAERAESLGYSCRATHKGGLVVDLGGEGNPLVLAAHMDDIGLMVRHVNSDGTLNLSRIGGLYAFNCTGENVRVYTRDGRVYTGTVCRTPNSIHVTEEELRATMPDYKTNVCVVLDENTSSAEETKALGVDTGAVIALEPRFTMSNGFIKSRFLDDKACVAILLTVMKELAGKPLNRKVYCFFSAYEEMGHGAAWIPEDTKDFISLDIAPTGPVQNSGEHTVTITAMDAKFPYHWGLTDELRRAAEKAGVNYVMDVFTPHYYSDGTVSVLAGYDIRHALIGPGTGNSHGYERTHIDAILNTYKLVMAYLAE